MSVDGCDVHQWKFIDTSKEKPWDVTCMVCGLEVKFKKGAPEMNLTAVPDDGECSGPACVARDAND